jgi:ankyrin repeat protein
MKTLKIIFLTTICANSIIIANPSTENGSFQDNLRQLCNACSTNDLEIVKKLVEDDKIKSINEVCYQLSPNPKYIGRPLALGTPLYCACKNNNFEIVKYLVKNGANIKLKDIKITSNPEIKKYLKKKYARQVAKTVAKRAISPFRIFNK